MTYCVAVKTETGIALVADSAVTSDQEVSISKSSFGETQINHMESVRTIQESALKIFDFIQSALTFAGDAKLGFEVATHRSMNSIQNRLAGLSMVEAGNNVEYVTLVGSAVALR